MSATVALITVMGLAMLVSVATKFKSVHCTPETLLQSKLLPMDAVLGRNWIQALSGRNGSTIQSKIAPCLTVQV